MNDVNEIKLGLKVRVISDDGTEGMTIAEKHLLIREVGKEGTVLNYVPGHGGDVWYVQQDNGVAAYCYTELGRAAEITDKELRCPNVAAFRFTWPGNDESYICLEHSQKLQATASAMGMHLQIIPIMPGLETCRQIVK